MQALTLMIVYVLTTAMVQFIGFLISRIVDYEWPCGSRNSSSAAAATWSKRNKVAAARDATWHLPKRGSKSRV